MAYGVAKAILATAAYGAVHSLLASRRAKDAAERWVGTRRRNAFYRPAYNAVAGATAVPLAWYLARQPGRPLYRAAWPVAAVMRLGQLGCLGLLAATMWRVGPLRFAGVSGLLAYFRGDPIVPREPEGQNPPADELWPHRGPFGLTRHPSNTLPLALLCLQPKMTSTRAAFVAAAAADLYVGSRLTDRRMASRYGQMYERYRQSGVPLFLPALRPPAAVTETLESTSPEPSSSGRQRTTTDDATHAVRPG